MMKKNFPFLAALLTAGVAMISASLRQSPNSVASIVSWSWIEDYLVAAAPTYFDHQGMPRG